MSTTTIDAPPSSELSTGPLGHFFTDSANHDPIRAELFGLEHLQSHARRLAHLSTVRPGIRKGHPLLRRFLENGRRLVFAHEFITEATRREESITSDAEWLLDNFHIIEDTLREIRTDLPRGYYRKLPKLKNGPYAEYPRVYTLALELIAHTDSSLDETNIARFVEAYQGVNPLTIGELWAVPIMLRLGLVENLRRLSDQMIEAWTHRREAEACAARLILDKDRYEQMVPPPPLTSVLRPKANWSDAFNMWLLHSLRDAGPEASWLIEWLESHLGDTGCPPPEVLRREQQRQAANQVSIGNCVTSLRLISALDWKLLVDRLSLVEAVLKDDPAGVYARQDFPTRDRYRQIVEMLAFDSQSDEVSVACCAVTLAARAEGRAEVGNDPGSGPAGSVNVLVPPSTSTTLPPHHHATSLLHPSSHIGYYLIGDGRRDLEAAIGYRPRIRQRLLQAILRHSEHTYFSALAVVFALALGGLMFTGAGVSWIAFTVLLVALLLPASELAVGIVHYAITYIVPPRVLPKLDLKDGVPLDCATFVVMPTMLIREESASVLCDRLEVHYLSNHDPNLFYGLLTDFADAPTESMPEDQTYLEAARERIAALNERYANGGADRFLLFHRRRVWNPVQGCWMGWERKRGKLDEFNRLLRGARDTSIDVIAGDTTHLPHIRYVITLDADTQLPRETARRLIGTLAHPLNHAVVDARERRVVRGYGVLQPRVSVGLVSATRSRFARILTASAGIDPYTTAVSDVYQDLFGRGTFTGKGIYDVDAFAATAGQVFPENHILSHDLIEGNYARCGLVTDIELLDDFPPRYHAYARREHRWIRGDWQLLPWLAASAPVADADSETITGDASAKQQAGENNRRESVLREPNPLPSVERWKIFDNLRRSLIPPAVIVLLISAWLLPGISPWFWTTVAVAVPALPLLLVLINSLSSLAARGSWKLKARGLIDSMRFTSGQVLLAVVFLAEQARLACDAIARTLVRLLFMRRHMLEWETAAAAERRLGDDFSNFAISMWPAMLFAAGLAVLVAIVHPVALVAAAPILLAWFISPAVAFWVSRPQATVDSPLTADERIDLRRLARQTWEFFDRFVGAEDNWLPPDNYQEDPKGAIAHRTSPTNIGLYLVSALAAHDFGYISLSSLLDRLEKSFATMDRLERLHGHFYNWYDTTTLQPLQPTYLSTVDSGNLLTCLLVLVRGLSEKSEDVCPGPAVREGLLDTLHLLKAELKAIDPPSAPEHLQIFRSLEDSVHGVAADLAIPLADPSQFHQQLASLARQADALFQGVQVLCRNLQEVPERLEDWSERFAEQVADALKSPTVPELAARCRELAARASNFAADMDFKLLYNEQRHLFSIGYNVPHNRLDNAHYDLLASEAALTSFLSIARGDVPKQHWFHLGRPLTRAGGSVALLSWGGTMFEYLMPRLFLRSYAGTLLEVSCRAAVDRQIEYGREHRIPWGVSESAFSALDAALDYQYQAFGVPGLGLKRGLVDSLVIAPYATALALAVRAHAAFENMQAISRERGDGRYGMYEAIDYTRDRREEKRRPAIVRSYMAHHQGMALIALANCLLDDVMVRRLHSEPIVRATELLLQERVPSNAPLLHPHSDETAPPPVVRDRPYPMSRVLRTPHTPHPRTHLVSNGRYSVMVTNAGGSYSTCGDIDVTRWREDRSRDCWGQFIYVQDARSGQAWSAGFQPLAVAASTYEVVFSSDKAAFRRVDGDIESELEITVSPENAAEVRRLTLLNHGSKTRELDITSYAEVVLGPHGADLAHPAFAKLFLETEFLPAISTLLCRRRPRSADQKPIWAVHVLAVEGPTSGDIQFETDRMRFLGRGQTPANPAALKLGNALAGTTGPVLDPIFSLRRRVRIRPGTSVSVSFTTAVAESREDAVALADQYNDVHGVNRAFELAWAHSQVQLQHLRLSPEESHLFQRLAAHVLYAGTALRATKAIASNKLGQPGLWRHGISGDKPIVLVRVAENEELGLVRQLLLAHAYWRLKGLTADLVILNDHPASYLEHLHEQINNLVRVSDSHTLVDKPGGVFVRRAAQLSEEDKILLQAAARVVLVGRRGSLEAQIDRAEKGEATSRGEPRSVTTRAPGEPPSATTRTPGARGVSTPRGTNSQSSTTLLSQGVYISGSPDTPLFANPFGEFSSDGKEYVIFPFGREDSSAIDRPGLSFRAPQGTIALGELNLSPAPWINVVCNPSFGFLISEAGAGYTWAGNSQSNRLTPWTNDPVCDSPGEVIYLRDEATGEYWTPTPLPLGVDEMVSGDKAIGLAGAPRESPRNPPFSRGTVRHGQGYTIFMQASHGLEQELLLFVPVRDPVKIMRLKVRNAGSRTRQLSTAFFCEWVLGTVRDQAAQNVVPSYDADSGALLARNPFTVDFADRVAFAAISRRPRSFTADRTEFLGRNGTLARPAALSQPSLTGRVESSADPCAAFMAPFDLRPGEEKEIVFFLGQASGVDETQRLLRRYREPAQVQAAFEEVRKEWDRILSPVQVHTPDAAMDVLLNRWLLYQVLSCRFWGRSAFYQSGGAYGFRDQLQDAMALVYGAPEEARAHLLRAASRQFLEGDVQHWWHPPAGRGVRTRFSDDFLWLPLVACHYVQTTGDKRVLDEVVPFLRSPALRSEQEEDYGQPEVTAESATLYEHCARAIENGLRFGSHGLPLMGTGDWNDGMNRVGAEGKGESVWNAWFLLTILRRFADLAETRGDADRAARYRHHAERLRAAIEEQAWDGRWYRRAYFDDGTPLGSAQNDECKIDSIAQSWAVISGVADPQRARQAMAAVEELLVRPADKMILLFAPPFDKGSLQPGYIKGYVPGIRENGGQYTHAATWVVQATALLGEGTKALQLFDLLNPINHAASPADIARYRVEPYVVVADIYGKPPHTGRGGWTWYTGSASWLYRVGLENILGFQLEGNKLKLEPCVPAEWKQYEITYRFRSTTYHITVENPDSVERGVRRVVLDGRELSGGDIELVDDAKAHQVQVVMGSLEKTPDLESQNPG
jgi:cyclic beta-1,2-glucan synthetase